MHRLPVLLCMASNTSLYLPRPTFRITAYSASFLHSGNHHGHRKWQAGGKQSPRRAVLHDKLGGASAFQEQHLWRENLMRHMPLARTRRREAHCYKQDLVSHTLDSVTEGREAH